MNEVSRLRAALAEAEAREAERTEVRRAEAMRRGASARVRTERAFAEMLDAMREASEAGVSVREICNGAGIARQTFYKWVRAGNAPATPFGSRGPAKRKEGDHERQEGDA